MLKALELVGFKSFADKTRFEFPEGITVVVGPNGSGKSNIVDAIKWVLGEQSVKSLRGKEMADVIFNGSGARRALNSAETTLTFDNSEGRLSLDTPDVHVTRRVYRSGEGEYLINGQPCRLRDIRDLFAGTGVSTQAYSIIEQGKVDVMLQSSPRDRRLIFEEAAGISRFKAKKIEAIRRLDRVQQNLLRLSDIVEEVESRLRVVQKQATKAERYKRYTDRLQDIRTQVALADWRKLTSELTGFEQQLEQLRGQSEQCAAQGERLEALSLEAETGIIAADEDIRKCQQTIAENRERIATRESAIGHERTRGDELADEIVRHQRQLAALNTRSQDLDAKLASTSQEVSNANDRYEEICRQAENCDRSLEKIQQALEQCRTEHEQHRAKHTALVRRAGVLASDATSLKTRLKSAESISEKCQRQMQGIEREQTETDQQLEALVQHESDVAAHLAKCNQQWRDAKQQYSKYQQELGEAQDKLVGMRETYSGSNERANVIDDLEQRQEGVSSGIRSLLHEAQDESGELFQHVRGLVADILEAQVEVAPLIDIALGDKAGYLVVSDIDAVDEILRNSGSKFSGRAGFVTVATGGARETGQNEVDLSGRPGVVGRADQYVKSTEEYGDLVERLLGNTWIVQQFSDAIALFSETPGENYVTVTGQFVGADGSICVGPAHSATGIISRRSQLCALRQQLDSLAESITAQASQVDQLNELGADAHAQAETLAEQREKMLNESSEIRVQVSAARQRQQQQRQRNEQLRADDDAAADERQNAFVQLESLQARQTAHSSEISALEKRLQQDEQRIEGMEDQRQREATTSTATRIELAKSEQLLQSFKIQKRQMASDHDERHRAIDETRTQLGDAQRRAGESSSRILQSETDVAELYLEKEELAGQSRSIGEKREQLRAQRGEFTVQLQEINGTIRRLESEFHENELEASQMRHQRDSLVTRMREDYEIELADLVDQATGEEEHQRETIEHEIADLRRKINNIGNVNLEALEELEDLETRFNDLSTQYKDLDSAKASLERIIDKINEDSRRLFQETLQTVRGHFQSLFRKLFGGGQADIIMDEEGVDILESGLEIVARPPGKEPRNISLLSGGEKTLTCVALLLAIFRSRPSPFCVLDEVDAALDEANIERFISVLKEFLQWTQFIVVTHSKKTMTCAGTLYGVTMQESGISKPVSVRFENVSETGEILATDDDDPEDSEETQAA